jgi:cell division protein FtsB/cell division protein DivIC
MSEKTKELPGWLKKILGFGTWILVGLLLVSTVRNIQRVAGIRSQVEAEKQKVEKMQADNTKLEEQVAEAQGSDFIEKQIRDKLGLVKPGEAIVVLPDADTLRKLAPQETIEEDTLPDLNWRKWEEMFF